MKEAPVRVEIARSLPRENMRAHEGCEMNGAMADPPISEERARRAAAVERLISHENRSLIEQGIEAYKHDLPRLLEARREHHKVAYRGAQQVAIASTYAKLEHLLRKKGFADERELFITSISRLEGAEQDSQSR
jgi:hypothetical protein